MKKKFISLVLAVTMFAPLISSFGISKLVDATDYPDPTGTVYELGTTLGTKYAIPQDSKNYKDISYKLGYNNTLSWQISAPKKGTYAFTLGGSWIKGTVFSYTCSFIPKDSSKETKTFSVTNTVETQYTLIQCTEHVELDEGQYTFELLQTSSVTVDVYRPYEDSLTVARYTSTYYLDNVMYSKKQYNGSIGNMTKVVACDDLKCYEQQPFSQVEIDKPYGLNVDVFYNTSKMPTFSIGSEKILFRYVTDANTIFAFFPYTNSTYLSQVKVSSPLECKIKIGSNTTTLYPNTEVSLNLSENQTITYTCDTLGKTDVPVVLMNSGNVMDSICFKINKPLSSITKDAKTAANGSISLINGMTGSTTIIDSDKDPTTNEVTEFLKRGNLSYSKPNGKYSYKFKLAQKYPMLCNKNGEQISSKGWCLIANNSQEYTGLGNAVAQDLYQQMNGKDALSYKFVNLYIDSEYHGVYQLSEKSSAQSKKNLTIVDDAVLKSDHKTPVTDINVSLSNECTLSNGVKYKYCKNVESSSDITGYVFEKTVTADPNAYVTSKGGIRFEIKEPNYPTENQVIRLANLIQDAEDAFLSNNGFNNKGKHYTEYLDIESMATIFLVETFFANTDWMAQSTYYTVDVDNLGNFKKIKSGSLWDMSVTPTGSTKFDAIYRWSEYHNRLNNYWNKGDFMSQMYIQNSAFANILEGEKSVLNSKIESMSFSMEMNEKLYNRDFPVLSSSFVYVYNSRVKSWNNCYTNKNTVMKGVTISNNGKTLIADVKGKCDGYQWYKIGNDGYTGELITDATSSSYTTTMPGKYYVVISGEALSGDEMPTTMVSNPISIKYSSTSLNEVLSTASNGDLIVLDHNFDDVDTAYTINEGITLDLNGHNIIEASKFTVNGQIIDQSVNKGIIEADDYSFGDDQKYLPIKDSSKGGYAFYDVSIEEQISGTNKLQFRMKKASSDSNAALDLIGNMDISLGYEVKACVTVDWKESDGAGGTIDKQEVVTFEDDWMSYVILGADGSVAPVKTYSRVFNFTINNLATLVADGKVKMQCSFVTYCGGKVLSSVEGLKWKTINGQTWFN